MNMSVQTEEMRKYFDSMGYRLKDIADKLGITPAAVSNMLAGRDALGKNRAAKLHEAFGFSVVFLLTGEGDLFQDDRLLSRPVSQTAKVNTNNGSINQTIGGACPSVEELLDRIDDLKAQIASEKKEKEWLRALVDKLTAATN